MTPAEQAERARLEINVPPVALVLFAMGAMCPKCGYGTRNTSKNWARCKKCGERVRRRALDAAHKGEG